MTDFSRPQKGPGLEPPEKVPSAFDLEVNNDAKRNLT
jgi:hypothetical protein